MVTASFSFFTHICLMNYVSKNAIQHKVNHSTIHAAYNASREKIAIQIWNGLSVIPYRQQHILSVIYSVMTNLKVIIRQAMVTL